MDGHGDGTVRMCLCPGIDIPVLRDHLRNQDLGRGPVGDESAAVDHGDEVGELAGDGEIVEGAHHRKGLLLPEFGEEF